MNKTELIAAMAEKTGSTKKDAEAALNAMIASISEALVAGEFSSSDSARSKRETERQEKVEIRENLAK